MFDFLAWAARFAHIAACAGVEFPDLDARLLLDYARSPRGKIVSLTLLRRRPRGNAPRLIKSLGQHI